MNRHAPAFEFPEFLQPTDVAAELGALEARVAAMQGGYSAEEVYREQIRGAMAVASAFHTQEVIGPRDRLWQDISTVIRVAAPFSVKLDHGSARARWAFVDATPAEELPAYAHTVMTAEASVRVDDSFQPEARPIAEALARVAEPTVYTRGKRPDALLGTPVRKVGFNQYQFDPAELTLRAAEEIVSQARSLSTYRYERFDFTKEWAPQERHSLGAAHAEVKQRDEYSGGLDETADWLKLRSNVDAAYDNDVLRIMHQALRERGVRTVQKTYDYMVEHYIEPDKASLADTQQVADWLLRPQVSWVTPRSLGISADRP